MKKSQPLTESNITQEYEHKSNLEIVLNIHQENISKQQQRSKILLRRSHYLSFLSKIVCQHNTTQPETK